MNWNWGARAATDDCLEMDRTVSKDTAFTPKS